MNHPESKFDLATLLKWSARGQGWAFREYPPQFKRLAGGAELVVVVPTLWRPRCGPRKRPEHTEVVDLARVRAMRTAARLRIPARDAVAIGTNGSADLFEDMQA